MVSQAKRQEVKFRGLFGSARVREPIRGKKCTRYSWSLQRRWLLHVYWIIIDRTWNGTPTAQWMGSRTKHKFRNVPSRKLQGHLSGMDLIVSECPCRYQNCVSDFCRTITLFLENEWKCASREHQTPQSDKYQSKEPTNHNHYYFCIISSWQCPNIPAAIPATKNIFNPWILGSSSPHQMAKY